MLPTTENLVSPNHGNYTGFPGLVQVAAESERGASLHGHRQCSQAGCPLFNGDNGGSALEGGLHVRERLSRETERDSGDVYSHV